MSNSLSKLTHSFIKNILYTPPQEGEVCTTIIKKELENEKPSMIARFGSTEIKAILYPSFPFYVRPFVKKRVFENMFTLSGFFPSNEQSIRKFSKMMLEDMITPRRVKERDSAIFFMLAKKKSSLSNA